MGERGLYLRDNELRNIIVAQIYSVCQSLSSADLMKWISTPILP